MVEGVASCDVALLWRRCVACEPRRQARPGDAVWVAKEIVRFGLLFVVIPDPRHCPEPFPPGP